MPTTNPRINITVTEEMAALLAKLAERDQMSVSAKVRQLVVEAMEMDEDLYFSKLAEEVDKETKKWVKAEDAEQYWQ